MYTIVKNNFLIKNISILKRTSYLNLKQKSMVLSYGKRFREFTKQKIHNYSKF